MSKSVVHSEQLWMQNVLMNFSDVGNILIMVGSDTAFTNMFGNSEQG